jgi:hypothetical protein
MRNPTINQINGSVTSMIGMVDPMIMRAAIFLKTDMPQDTVFESQQVGLASAEPTSTRISL